MEEGTPSVEEDTTSPTTTTDTTAAAAAAAPLAPATDVAPASTGPEHPDPEHPAQSHTPAPAAPPSSLPAAPAPAQAVLAATLESDAEPVPAPTRQVPTMAPAVAAAVGQQRKQYMTSFCGGCCGAPQRKGSRGSSDATHIAAIGIATAGTVHLADGALRGTGGAVAQAAIHVHEYATEAASAAAHATHSIKELGSATVGSLGEALHTTGEHASHSLKVVGGAAGELVVDVVGGLIK